MLKKRKREFEQQIDECYDKARAKLRVKLNPRKKKKLMFCFMLHCRLTQSFQRDEDVLVHVNLIEIGRQPNRNREVGKVWQDNACSNWDGRHFGATALQ